MSVLISPGLSGTGIDKHTKTIVFTLWALMSMVIVNLYTGFVTSHLISPVPDKSFSNLNELVTANYKQLHWHKRIHSSVNISLANYPDEKLKLYPGMKAFKKLIMRGEAEEDPEKFLEKILSGEKYAIVDAWPKTMDYIFALKERLLKVKTGVGKRKGCWIGKESVVRGNLYFPFLPPDSKKLERGFRKFVESGIYQRWDDESVKSVCSRRVQERSRVIFPTKVKEDEEGPRALELEGKVAKVFAIWAVCLAVAGGRFSLEWKR